MRWTTPVVPSMLVAMACAPMAMAEPLPTDPALVTGQLENGLSYIIRRHANPPERAGVWLHVSSGSLNETEQTRGIAHYLEHMAFNGSENFAPGTVVDYFQSIGLAFGRDQNAFTSFDQTTYQLYLPDAKPETVDRALLFMSDVAGRLKLLPAEIEEERGIIQEERRTRLGPQQRVQEYIFERLAPESTFGRRSPIGTEQTINSMQEAQFREFYSTYYVPSNMTLIIVADAEPNTYLELIKKQFGSMPKAPRPADLPVGVKGTTESRAIVASDAEITSASLQIQRLEPPRPPTTTVSDERRDLVELIGTWVFNRRIDAELASGKLSYLGAGASIQQLGGAMRLVGVQAAGKPENWQKMLADLGTQVQRARLHGFSAREVDDARKALVSQAEEGVQREPTLPARAMLARINGAIAEGEPVMSAQQRLDVLNKLLPTITAEEVSKTFATQFDPTHLLFVLTVPTSAGVPSEAEVVSLGRAAFDVKPEKAAEVAAAKSLMDKAPTAGKVVEQAKHEASGVTSAWLDNGVRMHHRFMDIQKGEATITITLAGGQINEDAKTRGLTDAASLAWDRPATSTLGSTQIRDLMTGKKARFAAGGGGGPRGGGGGGGPDALSLRVSGNPVDFEPALQLAHLMLTDPVIEPAALEQWKQAQRQGIEQRKKIPQGIIAEVIADAFYPADEARTRPLTLEQVDAITIESATAWLKKLIATSPIEVSVVGDISADQAAALVTQYLGSLPSRERISDKTLADRRQITRPKGPIVVEKEVSFGTQIGMVLDGFFATDARNIRDSRLMQLASRIISTRLVKIVREEKQLVYSISAAARPGVEYPGYGMFMATAPTEPSKAADLAKTLEEIYTQFAKEGPTEEELATARKQMDNMFSEEMKQPGYWIPRLSVMTYRGTTLDDILDAPKAMQAFTAADIRETFAKYYLPESRFRFVVKPTPKAGGAEGEKKAGKDGQGG